ncbi:MAG TPA: flagellar basal body-associated FliL family protein [Spirochaetota bacterium]|nr:flagellar basal body-associated FliL family protein [Spirochaetota bacterium]
MPEDMDDFNFGDDEGGEGEGAQAEAASGGGGLKRFLSGTILKVLMYVAAGIAVFIIALFAGKMGASGKSDEAKYAQAQKEMEQKAPPLATFELKEFMSNTADVDTTHFVRMKLSLGYEKNNLLLQTELSERRMQIFDLIMLTLNGKRKEDLDSAQKKQDLKDELIKKINGLLQNGKIQDIYYAEFSVN